MMKEKSNLSSENAAALSENSPQQSTEDMISNARAASDFLKAIAHEHRLLILCILAEGEKSVRELETYLNMRQPNVSQHLARLRADNLVTTRRAGKTLYSSLASDHALELISVLYKMFCAPQTDRDQV